MPPDPIVEAQKARELAIKQEMEEAERLRIKGTDFKFFGFSKISHFLERILMEHIDMKNSLDSQLQIDSLCSIRIHSRSRDIVEKPIY